MAEHAPTLNNLAVVLWRQNQFAGALNYYDKAMLASPMNTVILNNVAEALNATPAAQKGTPVEKKARRHFDEQDARLQEKMRQTGLLRWGATWVAQNDMDRLLAIQKEADARRAALSNEYDAARGEIERIGKEIEANNRTLRNIEADTWMRDADGRYIRLPYPSIYYELQRDNQRLAGARVELLAKLDSLRAAARQVEEKYPVQRYRGVQQLIGAEGAPAPAEIRSE